MRQDKTPTCPDCGKMEHHCYCWRITKDGNLFDITDNHEFEFCIPVDRAQQLINKLQAQLQSERKDG